jgi:hypothetical protein
MRYVRLPLLVLALLLPPSLVALAKPVAVRYPEGSVQSFLVLRSADGSVIALGEMRQVRKDDRVESRLTFAFYRAEPPGFLAAEGPLYPDGPIWRIEVATPKWPSEPPPRS